MPFIPRKVSIPKPRDPEWQAEAYQMIEDCRNRDSKISAWEADFLDSIEYWLNEHKELTMKQQERLDSIWNKATADG